MDYEDGFLTGPRHCMLVSLCTVWSASFVCCTSCIWSGTQLGISCSHAKAWISFYLRRGPPCQLQQRLWGLMLIRLPRVSHLVPTGNIRPGWRTDDWKVKTISGLLTTGLERKPREREIIPYHTPPAVRLGLQKNHDPILYTGWHDTDCCKTEHVYTIIGACVSYFRSRPCNLIYW